MAAKKEPVPPIPTPPAGYSAEIPASAPAPDAPAAVVPPVEAPPVVAAAPVPPVEAAPAAPGAPAAVPAPETPRPDPYAAPPVYGVTAPYGSQPVGPGAPPVNPPPGYAAQQPYAYAAGQYGAAPPQGLAIASLVTGLAALIVGPLASIAAVVLGHIAQKSQPWARGFWIAGLILGYIGIGLSVIFAIILIAFAATASTWQDF